MATFPIFVFQKAKDLMVNETPENTPEIHTHCVWGGRALARQVAKRQTLSKGTSNFSLGNQRTCYGKEAARAGEGLSAFPNVFETSPILSLSSVVHSLLMNTVSLGEDVCRRGPLTFRSVCVCRWPRWCSPGSRLARHKHASIGGGLLSGKTATRDSI